MTSEVKTNSDLQMQLDVCQTARLLGDLAGLVQRERSARIRLCQLLAALAHGLSDGTDRTAGALDVHREASWMERDLAVVESRLHDQAATIAELRAKVEKLSADLISANEHRKQLALIVVEVVNHVAHLSGSADDRMSLVDLETDARNNARR